MFKQSHHIAIIVIIIIIIAMLTFCTSIVSHATLIFYYHASISTIQTSLTPLLVATCMVLGRLQFV